MGSWQGRAQPPLRRVSAPFYQCMRQMPPSVLVPAGPGHIRGVRSAVPSRMRGVTSNRFVRLHN